MRKIDDKVKLRFIDRYKEKFQIILNQFGEGWVNNRSLKEVDEIAELARKELGYSDGTKTVLIVSTLHKMNIEHQKKLKYTNRASLKKKMEFIDNHLVEFDTLFDITGYNNSNLGGIPIVIKIAELARKELGYSEKTAAIDIVRILYDIHLKDYH